jgi:hypothetical protein
LPRLRPLALASAASAVLGMLALAWAMNAAPALAFGWSDKPAGRAIRALVSAATDVDRDGFGWLSEPSDPAPFDPTVHP